MIECIAVHNFKSLASVKLPLGQFTCLIGMNGAGKSTLLQAMDFLAQQMHGDIDAWLDARGWQDRDLYCKTASDRAAQQLIYLRVDFRLADQRSMVWEGRFQRSSLKCRSELVWLEGLKDPVLRVMRDHYRVGNQAEMPITFKYQGSILSQLEARFLGDEVRQLRDAIRGLRSLELLSPNLLRKRSRSQDKDIGAGGEKLSGFLATIKGEQKDRLVALLKQFYPQLQDFRVVSAKGGWKRLVVTEGFQSDYVLFGDTLETDASQLNDGLLRILAMLAQAQTDSTSLLLLDEVENGINPEIVEKLVDTLVHSPVQVMVTSHSPMILNYLDDEVARQAVQFVYKNPHGQTRVRRFFDLPRIGDKLTLMGPGEAFVDTNLVALTQECVALDTAEAFGEAQA